jgi:1,4-alpha-glucan branching enzyme
MSENSMHKEKPHRKGSGTRTGELTDLDVHLFREGRHYRLYEKLGAHPVIRGGTAGTAFSVWAPNAEHVSVIGDFNGWNDTAHPLTARADSSGIWEGFVPELQSGAIYKYQIASRNGRFTIAKSDPFASFSELPPKTASRVWDLSYTWGDSHWMKSRKERNSLTAAMSVYEVHLGSWQRAENGDHLTYREMAHRLA